MKQDRLRAISTRKIAMGKRPTPCVRGINCNIVKRKRNKEASGSQFKLTSLKVVVGGVV